MHFHGQNAPEDALGERAYAVQSGGAVPWPLGIPALLAALFLLVPLAGLLVRAPWRRPHQISGGQAQQVALARALAADPRYLLLDEPLSALDAKTRLDVRAQLRSHLAEFAGPVVLITHDPLEAMIMADRLLVIENGRVVQRAALRRWPASRRRSTSHAWSV